MSDSISINEVIDNKLNINITASVQMYAGDRGTDIFPTIRLNSTQVLHLINTLQYEYDHWEG